MRSLSQSVVSLIMLGALAATPALAQLAQKSKPVVPGFGSNSKEPIQIDADRLEVFSKEQRAVYTGNVVAIQGDTTIKSATMIVFYDRQGEGQAASGQAATGQAASGQGGEGTSLRRVEAKGGVTVISKDQVATGNDGEFDRAANRITLTGNVALTQGDNVTKGQKLVYNTETGVAIVEGRVREIFVPGSDEEVGKDKKKPAAAPQKPSDKPKS